MTLSLEHGNSDAACFAYVWLAMFAGPRLGNYKDGFRFGQLGYDLVEKRGLTRYQARTYMSVGAMVRPWAQHVASGRELVRRAFDAAYRIGDLTFASYSWDQLITICLGVGDPLAEVQTECENGLAFAKSVRFGLVIHLCGAQLGLIRTLRGVTPTLGRLDHDDYSEPEVERILPAIRIWYSPSSTIGPAKSRLVSLPETMLPRLRPRSMGNNCIGHRRRCSRRQNFASMPRSLTRARGILRRLETNRNTSRLWRHTTSSSKCGPSTRLRRLRAARRWLRRRSHGSRGAFWTRRTSTRRRFVPRTCTALCTAKPWRMNWQGCSMRRAVYEKIATTYLREARHCYLRWGADGKVRQLDQLYPQIRPERSISDSTATINTPVEQLDLATVIKVSEAVSGEIVPDRLIETIMRTALEHAGAERGLLILSRDDGCRIEAEATTSSD